MKKITIILIMSLLMIYFTGSLLITQDDTQTISIDKIPDSIEEFTEMRDEIAGTPEGGAAMFIVAMNKYVEDEDLGIQFFTLILDMYHLRKTSSKPNVKGYAPNVMFNEFLRRIKSKPYLPASYISGTSPENKYELPEAPYKIEISRNPYSVVKEGERIKVFVECSGADSARPITLQKNSNDIWKAYEFSSMSLGIREPEEEVIDEL
jgi:hypothetical protein